MSSRRTLTEGMSGEDVARLHDTLDSVGIWVDDEERARQHFGVSTRQAVTRIQLLLGLPPTGEVDLNLLEVTAAASERLSRRYTPSTDGTYIIQGRVTDRDGLPLRGVQVAAYRVTLREEKTLGQKETDRSGWYRIEYTADVVTDRAAQAQADGGIAVRLRVFDTSKAVRFTSGIHYDVDQVAEIPLSEGGERYAEPVEFLRTRNAISLRLGRIRLDQIEENRDHQDLTFLGRDSGVGKLSVAFQSIAARLSTTTGLAPELFYALFRQNVPADAAVRALAEDAAGTDLDRNAQRLLNAVLTATSEVREKAVIAALDRGTIPPSYAGRAQADLAKLADLGIDAALSASTGMGKTPVREVLTVAAKLSLDKQRLFMERWSTSSRPARAFWRDLRKSDLFTNTEITNLHFAMTIGRFTRGHLPLVDAITRMRDNRQIVHTRDLARLDATAWRQIVGATGIPDNFTALDEETAVEAYARLLERTFERAYPTVAFSARLRADRRSPFRAREAVVGFLDANPAFDLRKTNVDRYLKDKPDALNGDVKARESLLAGQRLLKLTSRYAAARTLIEDGIDTAQHIYSMGPVRFRQAYGEHAEIGIVEADRIYAVAEQTYAMALNLATNLGATIREVNPAAISQPFSATIPKPDLQPFPNMQTLFGSLDLCACEHCRSVLSPAAYLTDILRFISQRVTAGKSAKAVLLARRPDIAQLELSCDNTNTVLPYIDLVNELLEDAVAPPTDPSAAARVRQTTLSTTELNANPQYVNGNAYTKLASAVYPWALPFDLPLLEARAYLGQLGTDRIQLRRALREEPDLAAAETVQLAIEALGLSRLEADLITAGPLAAANQPWDYWGLAETGNVVRDPVETTKNYSGTWLQVLSYARILLARAQLTHTELQQVLATRFVNPDGSVTTSDTCDVGAMTVTNLGPAVLARLHGFARLMRALDWSPDDLDIAIAQLQAGTPAGLGRLNNVLLRQLRAVTATVRRFRIGVPEAIALLGGIDTHLKPPLPGGSPRPLCLYDRLFQNPVVLNPVDSEYALDSTRLEVAAAATGASLADHRDTLVAAFELADADVSRMIAALTDGKLTLANLARLYSCVLLARGLGLTTEEFLTLSELAEVKSPTTPGYERLDPIDASRPELLERFGEIVHAVREANVDIAQLDYLLRHRAKPGSGVALDDVSVGMLLKSIRDGLVTIANENSVTHDPTGVKVRQRLGTLLPATVVAPLMAITAGTSSLSASDQSAVVETSLGSYVAASEAKEKLVGNAALPPGASRYEYVLGALSAHTRRTLGTGFVLQQLADALALEPSTVRLLVSSWFTSVTTTGMSTLDQFLTLPQLARDTAHQPVPISRDEPGFAEYFTAYVALDKAARLIGIHGLNAEEVVWYREQGAAAGWLDPTTLPQTSIATPEGRFVRWLRVANATRVKVSLPRDGGAFGGLFDVDGTTKAMYLEKLATRMSWPAEDLDLLVGSQTDTTQKGLLGLTFPDDFRSERALSALLRAFATVRRLGVSVAAAGDWTNPSVTATQAAAIKRSVKAKYGADRWPDIAKRLRDPLRERQRDALVAYLLAHPPVDAGRWQTVNDVYARYLIDVEMSSHQESSRIVQAIAAVQLFMQRCALNLEPDVVVDAAADGHWREWRWMSRYRVWEANRKVFLWPENWIEPGLRRDKSPFFQDLENELLQAEPTKESVESTLRRYLEKLDAVARLDVVGTYFEAGTPTRLHVIGRKQGDPPTYYHREWVDSSRWTAWTKLDLDVISDHVLPVVWNRRLYLFWAVITRRADQVQQIPPIALTGAQAPTAAFHLEVQLAWSELRDGKWQPKQTAPQTFVVRRNTEPRDITLKSSVAGPLLRIDVFAETRHLLVFWTRDHVGEFVLGGVGNSVDAYAVAGENLDGASPATAQIGTLASELTKGFLLAPTGSVYDAMTLAPAETSSGGAARQQVVPLITTYDLYGALVSQTVLGRADRYRLVVPHQQLRFDSSLPFFYADSRRSYFIIPQRYYQNGSYFLTTAPAYVYKPNYRAQYTFRPNYHPFVPLLVRELSAGGVDSLYDRRLQANPAGVQGIPAFDFKTYYEPTDRVVGHYPIEGIDFHPDAPYSIYNWELFFHVPFKLGESLSVNQRFEEAKHVYEYVFDPTSTVAEPAPQRYWVMRRFHDMTTDEYKAAEINRLMDLINAHDPDTEHQVAQWRANPFDPHVIAGLRPVAYQRAIVMKYIDNLIAWGDKLFAQDTMESVNEATQLYVLAGELLGPRPEIVQPTVQPAARTFAELEPDLDAFSNAAVTAAENAIAPVQVNVPTPANTPQLPVFPPLYFVVPPNEKLLSYWDTVADRLFKIRHGMNVAGVARQLALFAPPIDPGMLVRAAAAGLDLGSVLSDSGSSLPPYRFRVMVRQAMQLSDNVRMLGQELLLALEKRDAEKLALIRSGSESTLRKGLVELRKSGVEEAQKQIDALARNREVAFERKSYFADRKDDLTNTWEDVSLALTGASSVAQAFAIALDAASGAAHMIPEIVAGASGAGGSPHATVKIGGPNSGRSLDGFAKAAKVLAAVLQTGASMSSVLGGYERRKQEWNFQHGLAGKELAAIDAQTLVLTIRKTMAEQEQANEETVRALADDTDDFLHDRFTNSELYEWMVAQISTTYFQAYRLAYGVAKQAEECFRHELGLADSSYIQFGYWDSLKKGLLAGEKLTFDLQRLESAYLAENARELELTKNVSLLQIDPVALVELRNKGKCTVTLPELLFDLETPGHYMRRLKSVAITVPAVVGPYGTVSLTATLLDNHIRTSPSAATPYERTSLTTPDGRFVDDTGGFDAIVTSGAQNDPGMFEFDHRDERYLPFEGAGAIGTWNLRLNAVYPQFDPRSISDVVLHLRYTARDGGEPLRSTAANAVRTHLNAVALAGSRQGLYKLVSPKQEFASQWAAFLHPAPSEEQVLSLDLAPDRFPFFTHGLDLTVSGIDVYAKLANAGDYTLVITRPGAPAESVALKAEADLGGVHHGGLHLDAKSGLGRAPASVTHPWSFKLQRSGAADFRSLTPTEISDFAIVFQYEVAP